MKKQIKIIELKLEEYLAEYGLEYTEGHLFDYPLSELPYIMEETDINHLALINNRLYEIPN